MMSSNPLRARLSTRRGTTLLADPLPAVEEIRTAIEQPGMQAVLLFCSPRYDLPTLGKAISAAFPCPVIACTTAGQIGPSGYQLGGITGASLASAELTVHPYLIAPLSECQQRAAEAAALVRANLERMPADRQAFGLLLADGLARAEEGLTAALYQGLGNVPIVGGSAGDELKFEQTHVYWEGEFLSNIAVVTIFDTSLPFSTFKVQHVRPTDAKLVITAADPASRTVYEMNGVPATEAYAEALGLRVEQLSGAVFSQHPVMLRIGADYYLRAIQRANADGSITFMCAIDEGLVLSIGEGQDPLTTLEQGFEAACRSVPSPSLVIGCDCILRRLELEERKLDGEVGAFLAAQKVIGFSTYGEQFNAVHVNQTFTGIILGE